MLIPIDVLENPFIDEFHKGMNERNLRYYASDLQAELDIKMENQLREAVRRAMSVCRSQQLVLDEHFKPIYRCEKSGIIKDWKLSKLAYCLVLLNCDPVFPEVGEMQLSLLRRHLRL